MLQTISAIFQHVFTPGTTDTPTEPPTPGGVSNGDSESPKQTREPTIPDNLAIYKAGLTAIFNIKTARFTAANISEVELLEGATASGSPAIKLTCNADPTEWLNRLPGAKGRYDFTKTGTGNFWVEFDPSFLYVPPAITAPPLVILTVADYGSILTLEASLAGENSGAPSPDKDNLPKQALQPTDLKIKNNIQGITAANNRSRSRSDQNPSIGELKKFLTETDGKNIKQDTVNPNIFTVKKENGKKAYWFLNVITGQYHQLVEYLVKNDGNASHGDESAPKVAALGSGACNRVYSRGNAPTLAIRKLYESNDAMPGKHISDSNLILSLLCSMENHKEVSKYINIGFIKSSNKKNGNTWKMIVPTVCGGTLTQMFGTKMRFSDVGHYDCRYGETPLRCRAIVKEAKQACKQDLQKGISLADNLEKHYQEFCEHAKQRGVLIRHNDLEPYNVMYNITNRCFTLIDGDSWEVVAAEIGIDKMRNSEERRLFEIIKNHH